MNFPKNLFETLPLFRQDLKIHRGPDEADGSPTYNLQDPIRGQYFKLGWKESLVIKCLKPGMTPLQLAEEINAISPLNIDAQDIDEIFFQCAQLGLLRINKGSEYYQMKAESQKTSGWNWLIQHYLYIRIPLLNPDPFLKRTLPFVRFLGSPAMITLYVTLTLWGLFLTLGRLDAFFNTFTYFFNLQGFLVYAGAISLVKLIHEFSHAYVGKRYGLHIPTMGVAFIVLWPVLYTDVTDGWKLSKRMQRLWISFAGIAAELIVAGLSTLGWALCSPGILQSVFFVLATTSWFSTLALNMNPAVRFDGYYILCDLLGVDNLQSRAFNVLRWRSYKALFGIETPPPEENLKPSLLNIMTGYAAYTYIYRIILYTTVALFVYFEFTKALGIVLFGAEVLLFMIYPIVSEIKELYMVKPLWNWNYRSIITFSGVAALTFWFMLPWPHEESYIAIVTPSKLQVLYVPYDSVVTKIYAVPFKTYALEDPLLDLSSKPLLKDLGEAYLQKKSLETEILNLSIAPRGRSKIAEKKTELAKAQDVYVELQEKQQDLNMKAKIPGVLYAWNDKLKEGQSVAAGTILGKIAAPEEKEVVAFIPETQIKNFHVGQPATIVLNSPLNYLKGTIKGISPARTENLAYFNLASSFKGPLPVNLDETGNRLVMVESYYNVYIDVSEGDNQLLKYGQRVEARIKSIWYSKFIRLIAYVKQVLIQESSL